MRIVIACIGRMKRGPEQTLFDQYAARLPWPVVIREREAKNARDPAKRMEEEAALLLDACKDAHMRIALDEKGKTLSSPELAEKIKAWQQQGHSRLAFIIGGSDGLAPQLRSQANLVLSFGAMTWPHMLVRPMLAEQLYRAHTLMTGHPYHRA
jgi:23S rRNA (pseudouridine1915-N3)-methyltransferase